MAPISIPTLLTLLPVALAAPLLSSRQSTDCNDVHVFLARGTGEDYPGRQISVVNAICNGTESATCGYEDIQYPASFVNPEYCTSVGLGVTNGTAQIEAYASACPDAQLVLSGYSQGAQTVGDILGGQLGGSTGCTDQTSTGLDPTGSPANQIKAVVFFGDVTHVANQTYNTANGTAKNGIDPRTGTQLERLNKYSDLLQSWCLENDPVCAGGDDIDAHLSYFDLFSEAARTWVLGKLTL